MKKTSKKRNKPVSTQKTLKELLETEKRILVEGAFEAMNGGQALSPTWKHNIGDRVNFAGYSDGDDYAEVIDSLYDGKIYYLRCVAFSKRRNEEGLGTMSVHYVAAPWIKVRPLVSSKTDVPEIDVREQIENKLDFRQGSISSLLNMYYYHGINMNPFYQRDLVWDEKDKEDLIESIFMGANIGLFLFRSCEGKLDEPWYEIIDGKQRLNTIIEFYENRLRYHGLLFDELPTKVQSKFQDFRVSFAIPNLSDEDVLRYFLIINRSGKRMDESHLKYVENLLNNKIYR